MDEGGETVTCSAGERNEQSAYDALRAIRLHWGDAYSAHEDEIMRSALCALLRGESYTIPVGAVRSADRCELLGQVIASLMVSQPGIECTVQCANHTVCRTLLWFIRNEMNVVRYDATYGWTLERVNAHRFLEVSTGGPARSHQQVRLRVREAGVI